jgi:hypothetical protein
MIKDEINVFGKLVIKKFNKNGDLVETRHHNNMIVHGGKQFVVNRMVNAAIPPMNHMAIGTGGTAPISANTSLEVEVARMAVPTPSVSDTTATFTGIFPPATGVGDITEAGIFNASSGGIMLSRTTFPAIQKEEGDTIAISWYISLA